jgi:flagellar biosynthesis anti-sigma factor FlgM
VRIDGSDPLSHAARLYAKSREVKRDSAVSEPGDKDDLSKTTERAQISEEARLLSLARDAFDRLPGVREDKVTYIKRKIESGEYSVDARKLARKLLKRLAGAGGSDRD